MRANSLRGFTGKIKSLVNEEWIVRLCRFLAARQKRIQSVRKGLVLAALAIAMILAGKMFFSFALATQPFMGYGSAPELMLEYTAAKNFAERGFFHNGLMVDYASSSNAVDHPYLYTHQPGGPAILLGVLLKMGLSLLSSRMVFSLITLTGSLVFFFLILEITGVPEIALLGMILYTFDYEGFIQWSDHFVHAFYGVNYFGSILFYLRFVRRPSRFNLVGFIFCLTLGFLTSFISCIPSFVCILVLHFALNYRSENSKALVKYSFISMMTIAGLHFGRNCVVLGPKVAFMDLFYTLGNRVIGWPSKETMINMFYSKKMVLWGVGKIDTQGFKNWLGTAISDPLKRLLPIWRFLAFGLILGALRFARATSTRRIATLFIVFLCTYAWHILFFAQGSIYAFPPLHRMFSFAIYLFVAYVFYLGIANVWDFCCDGSGSLGPGRPPVWAAFFFLFFGAGMFLRVIRTEATLNDARLKTLTTQTKPQWGSFLASYEKLRQLPPGTIFTNIDGVVANFFTDNLVFGGCDLSAMHTLDSRGCPSSFVDETTKKSAQPRYLLMSYQFVPGYQTCMNNCIHDLIAELRGVFPVRMEEKGTWVLFEIPQRAI